MAPPVPVRMPSAHVTSLRAAMVDSRGLLAKVLLRVENPNPFPILVERVDWELDVEGRSTAVGQTTDPVRVPPLGHQDVGVDVRAGHRESLGAGALLMMTGRAPYTLRMTLQVGTPLGHMGLPLRQTGELALVDLLGPVPSVR